MSIARRAIVKANDVAYRSLIRPFIFRQSAQQSHHQIIEMLRLLDNLPLTTSALKLIRQMAFTPSCIEVGGVRLPHPFMLAAGFVKGDGFADEAQAIKAVSEQRNIIPGWRAMPALVGAVEFGSFTRWPRLGNPGVVMWRDVATTSTQNRVGLKNPGAKAAATFLSVNRPRLPQQFGINIATSPGVEELSQECDEIVTALSFFLEQQVLPAWFTLNLSCPNTEDDPKNNQTEARAQQLCGALVNLLREKHLEIPLWVKISPGLAEQQYHVLMDAFQSVGVRAVIATNTIAAPTPDDAAVTAGVGGGRLQPSALAAAEHLMDAKLRHGYSVDVIGCGGIQDAASYHAYTSLGIQAIQYWSALVFRGPLAAAIIAQEAETTPKANIEYGQRTNRRQRSA